MCVLSAFRIRAVNLNVCELAALARGEAHLYICELLEVAQQLTSERSHAAFCVSSEMEREEWVHVIRKHAVNSVIDNGYEIRREDKDSKLGSGERLEHLLHSRRIAEMFPSTLSALSSDHREHEISEDKDSEFCR